MSLWRFWYNTLCPEKIFLNFWSDFHETSLLRLIHFSQSYGPLQYCWGETCVVSACSFDPNSRVLILENLIWPQFDPQYTVAMRHIWPAVNVSIMISYFVKSNCMLVVLPTMCGDVPGRMLVSGRSYHNCMFESRDIKLCHMMKLSSWHAWNTARRGTRVLPPPILASRVAIWPKLREDIFLDFFLISRSVPDSDFIRIFFFYGNSPNCPHISIIQMVLISL